MVNALDRKQLECHAPAPHKYEYCNQKKFVNIRLKDCGGSMELANVILN